MIRRYRKYMIILLAVFLLCCRFGALAGESIENVDYAVALEIIKMSDGGAGRRKTSFRIYVANLIEYRGSSEQMLETDEYMYEVERIDDIFSMYEEETGRALSLSHVKRISVDEPDEDFRQVLLELADYVDMSDTVEVCIDGESTGLLSYIRAQYKMTSYWE